MAINLNDLAGALTVAQEQPAAPRASRDQYGTIALDAQGTPTVMLDGGTDYAPCTCMVGVHHGDRVLAHVVNHKIVVFANITAPTTDDAQALVAVNKADAAAEAADAAGIAAASARADAATAKADAATAKDAAQQAVTDAEAANDAASAAQASADEANESAWAASTAAANAQDDATAASSYARGALSWLGQVEDVLGTVSWIAEHGEWVLTADTVVDPCKQYWRLSGGAYESVDVPDYAYEATEDTSFQDGKRYYAYDAGTGEYAGRGPDYAYIQTEDATVQDGKEYYVLVEIAGYEYAPTSDAAVQDGKGYYTRTGSGTDADPYVYDIVEEPVDADVATYYERVEVTYRSYESVEDPMDGDIASYYELTATGNPCELGLFERVPSNPAAMGLYVLDTSGSVANYIATHLALTDEGLRVMAGGGYSLLLASDGITLLDGMLNTVAYYGENMQIGASDGMHIEASGSRLSFKDGEGNEVAYIAVEDGISTFYMNRSVVLDDLRFGNWKWYNRENGHMTLQYVGADEVEA